MFIFGDSYVDAGNNNYINTTNLDKANFSPYGQTFFHSPTGRFSDGRLLTDFIATYAKLPFLKPYLQPGLNSYHNGVNFASAGAGVLSTTFQGEVIDLQTQLSHYKKVEHRLRDELGNDESKKKKYLSKAVYLFSIGTNDYMSLFVTNSTMLNSFSHSQYVGTVIRNLTVVIKEVYKTGARKFVFINLPNLGCLPGMRIIGADSRGSCLAEASSLSKLHNKELTELLIKLEKQMKGFKYSIINLNNYLKQRMDHPTKYGLKEGKAACCGIGMYRGIFSCGGKRIVKEFQLCENPNEYVFWDSYHFTEMFYKQLADQIWREPTQPNLIGPYNLSQLFILPVIQMLDGYSSLAAPSPPSSSSPISSDSSKSSMGISSLLGTLGSRTTALTVNLHQEDKAVQGISTRTLFEDCEHGLHV
ncbi:hypothetical protein ACFE04_003808 [Oxalis oulophora]